ncbi:MAG: acylphosphatase [Acetobacter sp.]|nr:acylphosphatase [Acetobacter sp.]
MKIIYLKIEGRVQRVGFRRWVVFKALEIGGISGWVRNLEDGGVEILVRGEEALLDEMFRVCHQGPLFARVDKVSFEENPDISFLPQIQEGRFIRL